MKQQVENPKDLFEDEGSSSSSSGGDSSSSSEEENKLSVNKSYGKAYPQRIRPVVDGFRTGGGF